MLDIIICDDNKEQLRSIENVIEKFILIEDLDMKIVLASTNPSLLLDYVQNSQNTHLYFLDVDLQNSIYNGFTLSEELRKYDPRGVIVFITTHSEMSHLTFQYKIEAMDYILKDDPAKIPERILQCMRHACELFSNRNNTVHKIIRVTVGSKESYIKQKEIICIEAASKAHKIRLTTLTGIYEYTNTIQEIAGELDECFFQCHKSYIINLDYLISLDRKARKVTLCNNVSCDVSFRKISALSNYISSRFTAES